MRVVCISDTHLIHRKEPLDIPDGDLLLHAGDATFRGRPDEIQDFKGDVGGARSQALVPLKTKSVALDTNRDQTCHAPYCRGAAIRKTPPPIVWRMFRKTTMSARF